MYKGGVKVEEKKKKTKKWYIIIGSIIVGLVAIAVISAIIIAGPIKDMNNKKIQERREPMECYGHGLAPTKPIIYLYPEERTELTVKLKNKEKITCSYPKYKDAWRVIANPDGTLVDIETGRSLYALYWEGKDMEQSDITEGFIVKRENTAKFLEEKLEILGLNYKEAEEFIVYWLPKLEQNEYNYIRFATMEEINEYMPLEFSHEPDTLIRILMEYKGLSEYIEVPEQKLETTAREGFVVVEWGGTELK